MINPVQSSNKSYTRKKKTDTSSKTGNAGTGPSFFQILRGKVEETNSTDSATMSESLNAGINGQIESLYAEYQQRENNLLDFPSTQTFNEYKSHIKELLSLLIKKSYAIKVYKDVKKREYEVVRTVDKSLRALYFEIAEKAQKMDRSLSILGKIRGLLLDLQV